MSPEEILKLEVLAGLRLDEDERAILAERLDKLLGYVRQIESIDSSGVEPMASTLGDLPALRADVVEPSFSTETALSNAPDGRDSHFRIPPVMQQGKPGEAE